MHRAGGVVVEEACQGGPPPAAYHSALRVPYEDTFPDGVEAVLDLRCRVAGRVWWFDVQPDRRLPSDPVAVVSQPENVVTLGLHGLGATLSLLVGEMHQLHLDRQPPRRPDRADVGDGGTGLPFTLRVVSVDTQPVPNPVLEQGMLVALWAGRGTALLVVGLVVSHPQRARAWSVDVNVCRADDAGQPRALMPVLVRTRPANVDLLTMGTQGHGHPALLHAASMREQPRATGEGSNL